MRGPLQKLSKTNFQAFWFAARAAVKPSAIPGVIYPVLILLCLASGCLPKGSPQEPQALALSEQANFDFALEGDSQMRSWRGAYRVIMDIEADSSETLDGKPTLKIHTQEFLDRSWPLHANLQQRILLPRLSGDSTTISISCKTRDVQNAALIITAFNSDEDSIYSETISCISDRKWQTFSATIPSNNAAFLHFELKATSQDTAAAWWLGKMNLYSNGENMGALSSFAKREKPALNHSDLIPLSFQDANSYAAIPDLTSKKLLALGESVHGSASINQAVMQLIKHQVAHNNTRLIVLEMPMGRMLSYNRFIQGDEDFQVDSLLSDYYSNISAAWFGDLLHWLKDYNKNSENKVWLAGMDLDIRPMNAAMSLFDYLYTLNQTTPHPTMRSFCSELLNTGRNFEAISRQLERDSSLKPILGATEFALFKYIVDMNSRITNRRIPRSFFWLVYERKLWE